MHKKITLLNKLRLLVLPLKESHSVAVTFYVRAGSRFETAKNNGIAHFLEHMAFKATKDFASEFELSKFVEGFGGHTNASTGEEEIRYFIRAETSHLKDIVYVLDQMLFKPRFDAKDIDKERGVIIEELNMYNDVPEYKVSLLVDALTWPNHPLGRFTVGTKETLNSFVRDDFVSYSQNFYSPSNMVIGISGNFQEAEAQQLIEKYFSGLVEHDVPEFERLGDPQQSPRVVAEKRASEQTHVCVNFLGVPLGDSRWFAAKLASGILGGGMSSRLFQKIRADLGLAYYVNSHASSFLDTGVIQISAGLNNEKAHQGVSEILAEVKKFVKEGVTDEELTRNKELHKGLLAIRLEDHQAYNGFLSARELLKNEVISYEDYLTKINAVTKDGVNEVIAKLLTPQTMNVASVGNLTEDVLKSIVEG